MLTECVSQGAWTEFIPTSTYVSPFLETYARWRTTLPNSSHAVSWQFTRFTFKLDEFCNQAGVNTSWRLNWQEISTNFEKIRFPKSNKLFMNYRKLWHQKPRNYAKLHSAKGGDELTWHPTYNDHDLRRRPRRDGSAGWLVWSLSPNDNNFEVDYTIRKIMITLITSLSLTINHQ